MESKQAAIAQLQSCIATLDKTIKETERFMPEQIDAARRLDNPYLEKFVKMGDADIQQMRELRKILEFSINQWR